MLTASRLLQSPFAAVRIEEPFLSRAKDFSTPDCAHDASRSTAQPCTSLPRRLLASVLAVLVAKKRPTRAFAQEAATTSKRIDISQADYAEELVYPGWFSGKWNARAELIRVEVGPKGLSALRSMGLGLDKALHSNQASVGKQAAITQAACLWNATSPTVNGISPGFAVEEKGGICAGTVAASAALAGRNAPVTPPSDPADDAVWEVQAAGGEKWQLVAAGAVGQAEENADSYRISELFEVKRRSTDKSPAAAIIRVVTVYRKPPETEVSGQQGSLPASLQAVQTTTILSPSDALPESGKQGLAVLTTVLLFSRSR